MTVAPASSFSDIKQVFILLTGDTKHFVQSLAAAQQIRKTFKRANITVLTTLENEHLAAACPQFNTIMTDGEVSGFKPRLELIRTLRQKKFDWVFDLTGSEFTKKLHMGFLPFAPKWSGPAKGCSHYFDLISRQHLHIIDKHAQQLELAGLGPDGGYPESTAPGPDLSWVFDARPSAPSMTPAFFGLSRPYVLMVPGGKTAKKFWPLEDYKTLAQQLTKQGYMVAVINTTRDPHISQALANVHPKIKDLTGRTDQLQLIALAAQSSFAVGDHSTAMHMVAGSGVPSTVFFHSSQNPDQLAPRGQGVMALHANDLSTLAVEDVLRAMKSMTAPAPQAVFA